MGNNLIMFFYQKFVSASALILIIELIGPWEGYLEVRGGKNQSWGHVCDSFDEWTIQEATIICQHLGFSR